MEIYLVYKKENFLDLLLYFKNFNYYLFLNILILFKYIVIQCLLL